MIAIYITLLALYKLNVIKHSALMATDRIYQYSIYNQIQSEERVNRKVESSIVYLQPG